MTTLKEFGKANRYFLGTQTSKENKMQVVHGDGIEEERNKLCLTSKMSDALEADLLMYPYRRSGHKFVVICNEDPEVANSISELISFLNANAPVKPGAEYNCLSPYDIIGEDEMYEMLGTSNESSDFEFYIYAADELLNPEQICAFTADENSRMHFSLYTDNLTCEIEEILDTFNDRDFLVVTKEMQTMFHIAEDMIGPAENWPDGTQMVSCFSNRQVSSICVNGPSKEDVMELKRDIEDASGVCRRSMKLFDAVLDYSNGALTVSVTIPEAVHKIGTRFMDSEMKQIKNCRMIRRNGQVYFIKAGEGIDTLLPLTSVNAKVYIDPAGVSDLTTLKKFRSSKFSDQMFRASVDSGAPILVNEVLSKTGQQVSELADRFGDGDTFIFRKYDLRETVDERA